MKKSSYKASTIPKNLEVVHLICVKKAYFHANKYIFKPGDITWLKKNDWEQNTCIHPEDNIHCGNYNRKCFKVLNIPKLKIYLL